ncbi:hypothetical protein [Citreimonas sp.]|uniref:hypothetical protein n=1 Tax=Citreimonas sp. TaxID=3036715 RepID=UPI0035C7C118
MTGGIETTGMRGRDAAAAIAQRLVEQTGAAMLSRDFDAFAAYFRLPCLVATPEGARMLEHTDELRGIFERLSAHYLGFGDVTLDRRVIEAMFDGPDLLRFSFSTTALVDGTVAEATIAAHSTAARDGDTWHITDNHALVAQDSVQNTVLMHAGLPEDTPAPVGTPEVLAIFQKNLDALTCAYFTGDFDRMRAAIALPLFKQGSRGPQLFATEDELRADFEKYLTEIRLRGITDLVRTVHSAHALGAARIHGTCRTHVLSGEQLVMPSYLSAITLEQGEDLAWRMTSIMHPLETMTLDRVVWGGA